MRAKTTDFTEALSDTIGIGSIVELKDLGSGEKIKYTILGAWDREPENNILSYLTPMGQSIIGKKVGDNVQIDIEGNEQALVIEGISRWVEQN